MKKFTKTFTLMLMLCLGSASIVQAPGEIMTHGEILKRRQEFELKLMHENHLNLMNQIKHSHDQATTMLQQTQKRESEQVMEKRSPNLSTNTMELIRTQQKNVKLTAENVTIGMLAIAHNRQKAILQQSLPDARKTQKSGYQRALRARQDHHTQEKRAGIIQRNFDWVDNITPPEPLAPPTKGSPQYEQVMPVRDPTLPSNWAVMSDPHEGTPEYLNLLSGKRTHTKPTAPATFPPGWKPEYNPTTRKWEYIERR